MNPYLLIALLLLASKATNPSAPATAPKTPAKPATAPKAKS
jgi:hypothetical protein